VNHCRTVSALRANTQAARHTTHYAQPNTQLLLVVVTSMLFLGSHDAGRLLFSKKGHLASERQYFSLTYGVSTVSFHTHLLEVLSPLSVWANRIIVLFMRKTSRCNKKVPHQCIRWRTFGKRIMHYLY